MDTNAIELIKDGGVIAALVFFIVGGAREWWYFAPSVKALITQHEERLEEMRGDRDYWRDVAQQALDLSKEGVGLAERRNR